MIIGRNLIKNSISGFAKQNLSTAAIVSPFSQRCGMYFYSTVDIPNDSNQGYFEKSGLKKNILTNQQSLQKQKKGRYNNNQRQNGILSVEEQKQLNLINKNLIKPFEQSNDKNEDETIKGKQSEDSGQQDVIQNSISKFIGKEYDGKIKDDFFQLLNSLTEEKVQELDFFQVCTFILENGRNPNRKKFKYIYKKTLNRLMQRFMELSPLPKILEHIEKNNNEFKKADYSIIEFEFLRQTLPQVIISLQNCGYYDNLLFEQYYKIFISKGFQESSNMMVKTIVGLLWSYIKFDANIDYNYFIDFIFKQEQHVIYLNALRILWLLSTHFSKVDNLSENTENQTKTYLKYKITTEQYEQIKQLFMKKLDQQNIIIFNNKNSVQLLQIAYKMYPQYAVDIFKNNEKTIATLCETDIFFKAIYPLIKHSQDVIRFKHENGKQSKIVIFDKKNNEVKSHVKQYTQQQSIFEKNVLAVIKNMNPELKITENVYVGDAYEIDILVEDHNIVFEINGDSHYYFDRNTGKIKLFAKTLLKQEIIRLFGIKNIVNINQFHWYKLKTVSEMEDYIIQQLKHARVNIALFKKTSSENAGEENKQVEFASQKLQNNE